MRMNAPAPALSPEALAALLAAAGEPTRLRILALLLEAGELCVCDLEARLGLPQPTVSRHLGRLLRAGLIARRRAGVWSHYRLAGQRDPSLAAVFAAVATVGDLGLAPAPTSVCAPRIRKGESR